MVEPGRPSYEWEAPAIALAALATLVLGAGLLVVAITEASEGNLSVPVGSLELGLALIAGGTVVAGLLFRSASGRRFRERDALAQYLDLDGAPRLLDVGCGRGFLLLDLLRRTPHGTGVGVEPPRPGQSRELGERFRSNALAEGVGERAALVAADPRDLPFRDSSFDVVVSPGRARRPSQHGFRTGGAPGDDQGTSDPGGQLALVVTDPSRMPSYGEVLDAEGFESEIQSAPGLFSAPLVISRKAASAPPPSAH